MTVLELVSHMDELIKQVQTLAAVCLAQSFQTGQIDILGDASEAGPTGLRVYTKQRIATAL